MSLENLHNEKELLEQVATGDGQAFRALFDRYFDLVYSTALRYTVIRQLAEDAAQQVFLKIWENRSELKKIQRIEPYLFTAAKREILQHFRRQATRRDYVLHVVDVFEEARSPDPESILISKEHINQLQEIIARLPARQREAFQLSRDSELTYAEIGARMGISRDTVKEHISQVLKILRDYVRERPDMLCIVIPFLLS